MLRNSAGHMRRASLTRRQASNHTGMVMPKKTMQKITSDGQPGQRRDSYMAKKMAATIIILATMRMMEMQSDCL